MHRPGKLQILLLSTLTFLLFSGILVSSPASAQNQFSERLPRSILDVNPPSSRVSGIPGAMAYLGGSCLSQPPEIVRKRIVDIAIQEWAYFGYEVLDLTDSRDTNPDYIRQPWRRTIINPNEAIRAASSIAGYWSATPDSAWILERQNQSWEAQGAGSRWRNPWSAAFISWVMCESGLGEPHVFRRAIAHHSYIDQAITATDENESLAAYTAVDPGTEEIVPGDLLCRGSRPAYRSIEDRRQQLGMGARSHCDIVVKLDPANERIMLIGGNVRSWVRLKMLPAEINNSGFLAPVPYDGRRIFAHLKLRTDAVAANSLEQSPTLSALSCEEMYNKIPSLLPSLETNCS
jgi:hypothetical protein